jgi:hypothetical protein
MTERTLYAGLVVLIGWLLAAVTGAAQEPVQPPCALCLAVTMAPGQALLLPDELHGLTVLVRERDAPVPAIREAVEAVRRRGGRPGVFVALGDPDPPADLRYRTKLRLTELRASLGADLFIAVESTSVPEFRGYADVLVGQRPEASTSVWPLLRTSEVQRALAATTRGGADHWVVPLPDDAIAARTMLFELASHAAPPPDAFSEGVEVRGARTLTADEIVARHQAFARRQAALVTRTISSGTLALTFEAPGFPAPVSITSRTIIYGSPGRTEIEQRSIRVNGMEFKGRGVPRLPILEPERAAAPPLTITLTDLYRYRRLGDADANGVRCHVVAFEPIDARASLFAGRAWISIDDFAIVRIAAVQTNLRGAIVSSEQVDDFRRVTDGVWLLAKSDVRQIYEGATHRTPIHRLLTIETHEVDPPDFDTRVQAAYASSSVMLRDTPAGYRYLRRQATEAPAGTAQARVVPEVAKPSTRVRTLAAGVIIDPNISIPLPFAGLSYVDFDLFGTGTQLNAFFGGSYAQLAFSLPSVGGTRWQVAGRAFGIATSYNDRSFREGREIFDENLRQRPAHASIWTVRPISPRVTIRAGYEFDYTRLEESESTATIFVVPANQVVHGARISVEAQRDGWAGSVWWNPAHRAGWRTWGRTAEDYSPRHGGFQRYGATISRTSALATGLLSRFEASVMAGRDLDRFSRYSFGTFDNRLRGYPSALVRYDRGAVLRGTIAWTPGRFVRLDGFVDSAVVRDRGFGRAYRNYTGVGAAVEAPMPLGILGAIEWGYGIRGLNADGSRGTHVVRVSAFRIF